MKKKLDRKGWSGGGGGGARPWRPLECANVPCFGSLPSAPGFKPEWIFLLLNFAACEPSIPSLLIDCLMLHLFTPSEVVSHHLGSWSKSFVTLLISGKVVNRHIWTRRSLSHTKVCLLSLITSLWCFCTFLSVEFSPNEAEISLNSINSAYSRNLLN